MSSDQDPYALFQPPPLVECRNVQFNKHRFFEPRGYCPDGEEWWVHVSGVPYLWDFGLLLLKSGAWTAAIENSESQADGELMNSVFSSLTSSRTDIERRQIVPWRRFLGACQKVALWHSHPHLSPLMQFDIDMSATQSFACLVCEIWASELAQVNEVLFNRMFPRWRHQGGSEGNDLGLFDLLKGGEHSEHLRWSLFLTWALLAESLDAKSFTLDTTRLTARPSPLNSVAERHWYSTGSLAWQKVGGDKPVIPARLPGVGTVRGDWFLMVGKESRSQRLGERAIDLLCRRRSNQERMELGMGLPVRRLNLNSWIPTDADPYSELLTAMAKFEPSGRRRFVRYGELLNFGSVGDDDEFRWLWRSRLRDYHRHDRLWEKWLGRVLVESSKRVQMVKDLGFSAPFQTYDFAIRWKAEPQSITIAEEPLKIAMERAWAKFNVRCDSLVSELSLQPHNMALI